jgi:DNA-binding MarR family transcriptional regulator
MSLEKEILREYLHATHAFSHQFREHFGKVNLTFPQALVLTFLETEGTVPISALADLTGSANSTISGVVDRLERMGLVRRKRSETDRRVIYVELTEKYAGIRDTNVSSVSDYFATLLKPLNKDEHLQVLTGLQLLCKALSDADEGEDSE